MHPSASEHAKSSWINVTASSEILRLLVSLNYAQGGFASLAKKRTYTQLMQYCFESLGFAEVANQPCVDLPMVSGVPMFAVTFIHELFACSEADGSNQVGVTSIWTRVAHYMTAFLVARSIHQVLLTLLGQSNVQDLLAWCRLSPNCFLSC